MARKVGHKSNRKSPEPGPPPPPRAQTAPQGAAGPWQAGRQAPAAPRQEAPPAPRRAAPQAPVSANRGSREKNYENGRIWSYLTAGNAQNCRDKEY